MLIAVSDLPRGVRADEVAIVRWLLTNACVIGPLDHVLLTVQALRVVGGCPCGCSSVDFVARGQAPPYTPIAACHDRQSCA